MTKFHAVLTDECGSEFGATVTAESRDSAYEMLQEDYPESRVIQLESPEEFKHFEIAQLRGQCRIASAGMTIRGTTKRALADAAGEITGKKYKTKELHQAAEDITTYLKENYR